MKMELLGNIIEISKGKKHNVSENPAAKSKRIIGISDLRNNDNVSFTDDKIGVEAFENDILIAWDGANAGTIGYGKEGFIGSTIARLRIKNTDEFDTIFVGKLLQTKFRYLQATSTGATIPHINRNALEKIKIPLPPLDDQKRIAAVLSRAEQLIVKRKESIRLLDEFLKSTFLEMFGKNDKWEKRPLSILSEIVSGVTKGKKNNGKALIEIPYMRVANVQDGHLDLSEIRTIEVTQEESKRYKLIKGDLLLTEGGDPDKLGRGSIWNNGIEACIHQNHIFRVRILNAAEINVIYLSHLISSTYGKAYFLKAAKQTTGIASINSTQLKAFPVIIAPIIAQNIFTSIVMKIEPIKTKYQQSLDELEKLYGSLSQRAFKGELDLSCAGSHNK